MAVFGSVFTASLRKMEWEEVDKLPDVEFRRLIGVKRATFITGFINPNESPISAVKREYMEELGLAASNANLVGIYPFEERNQVIMVYHVEANGDIALNDELHSFKLFSRQELQKWPFGQ